ncbi:hypothetical protein P8452_15855 [Trifolium repens]|nr:hypothetical protein P8452_15855 [Trifolium repens]
MKVVMELKGWGFDPKTTFFITALCAKSLTSDWQRKVGMYKKWGWSKEDIVSAFLKYPWCMLASLEKIEAVMGFFVKEIGWESTLLAKDPILITLSLERRIVPRAFVLKFLESKGLIEDAKLAEPFEVTEKEFLKNFVDCFKEEASQLLKLYEENKDTPNRALKKWESSQAHADFTPPPPSLTADLVFTPPSPSRCSSTTGMSLAAAGDPPVPPPGGGGDLGGHGSNSSRQRRAGRGRGKKLAPRQLKHRVVYNRDLTDMPRRVLEDGSEVPLEPDPEEETRVDTEITRADLLAPDENILVDRHGRIVLMPYADDFQPQKHASVAITKTIVANYHEPFISWKEVKKNKKAWESFWNTFRNVDLKLIMKLDSNLGSMK